MRKPFAFICFMIRTRSVLREKLVCPEDHQEVSREDTVRGFEIEKDKNVVLTTEGDSSPPA